MPGEIPLLIGAAVSALGVLALLVVKAINDHAPRHVIALVLLMVLAAAMLLYAGSVLLTTSRRAADGTQDGR